MNGMMGGVALALASGLAEAPAGAWRGGFAAVGGFGPPQWLAIGSLGLFGGAAIFFLWSPALQRTTPTKVAVSVTVNPVTASLVGVVSLGEPIGWALLASLVMVFAGIWGAATGKPSASSG